MRLLKVYSNKESFRTVEFNRTGISFVVAKQKNPESNDQGKSYNGVGKSLLVHIIHFCLGASPDKYKEFCKKLPDWEFFVDYEIDNKLYTAKRTTNDATKIIFNNEGISVTKFNEKMESLCFNIPDGVSNISFRSLLPFFIRPKKESYVAYNKPGSDKTDYQILIKNAFLLGLDVTLVEKKYKMKKEKDRIKQLENNFKKDSLLRDFFTGNRDATLTLMDLNEHINKIDADLSNFKVAEDYNEVQLEADKVESELYSVNNTLIMLKNNIENINNSINFSPDQNKENIKSIYKEVNINFSDGLIKTLDELEVFYDKLISNRKRRLLEQQNKLRTDYQNKKTDVEKLQKRLDDLMQYLGEHQALDIFVSLSKKNEKLKAERDSLNKYQELRSEYKTKERQIEKDIINLNERTEKYLIKIEPDMAKLREYFRSLAKIFYPDAIAGLTIESNNGDNQSCFNIDAKIESDASDGINNVKIFCYDLTILFEGYNHDIDFIFHDSRLFDGTDERQKTCMFNTIYLKFANENKQYIATVNQNQLDEIKKYMQYEVFETIINNNIVLTLTDDSDDGKLLGIKADFRVT